MIAYDTPSYKLADHGRLVALMSDRPVPVGANRERVSVRDGGSIFGDIPSCGTPFERTTSPGRSSERPTRLVAWMYSACIFGCPSTSISPRRGKSRPTEIMFVASAQSTRLSRSLNGHSSRRRATATLSVDTREVSSSTSENVDRPAPDRRPPPAGGPRSMRRRSVLRPAQRIHRQLDAGDIRRHRLLNFSRPDPRRADRPALVVDEIPLGRHAMPGGVLRRIGVVEIRDPIVPLAGVRPAQVWPRPSAHGPAGGGVTRCRRGSGAAAASPRYTRVAMMPARV